MIFFITDLQKKWLRGEESNLYYRSQSPACYHYSTPL